MTLFDKILNDEKFLEIANKIEDMNFISDGKWDWEHGLGHYKRVAEYIESILYQLNADERTIELGKVAALLHDVGLVTGQKEGHAVRSAIMFEDFLSEDDVTEEEREVLRQAIYDHSSGKDIQSLIGLSLLLADKLDVTYHRTINSCIQDEINKEIQKIKSVDIVITDKKLLVNYVTLSDFNVEILRNWDKSITVPKKVSDYLGKDFVFSVNEEEINCEEIF